MTTPCIITVAITGSLPRKEHNSAVPISIAEQVEATQQAYEAGASVVHLHVRNDDQTPTSNPARFAEVQTGIKKHCPGMVIQFSTGGRSGNGTERGGMLPLRPDMASLSTGSCNFPAIVYSNPPDLIAYLAAEMAKFDVKPEIEAFDLSMLYQAVRMAEEGLLPKPLHVQFVSGIKNAMPAIRQALEFQVLELKRLMPDATWAAAGIGKHQIEVNRWTLELGGHCRTGLEDNVRFDATRLAKHNAELVKRVADLCGAYDRHPANCDEARAILHLRPAAAGAASSVHAAAHA
jgi:3-keto-5-aminohexanoate cleavage enzyme